MRKTFTRLLFSLLALFVSYPSLASDKADAEQLVRDANTSFSNFIRDPDMTWMRNNMKSAKGVLVVPALVKGGVIFGGSGGNGVLLSHESGSDSWSYPAFYTMGSVSWGLQLGAEVAEVVLMIMTDKGMDAVLSNKFQLGADASVAAGPVGAGAQAATADVLQFARSKGIFGGLTLEGSVIAIRETMNQAYYGQAVRPLDILVKRTVSNPQANTLRSALANAKR
jgi:lipid-binding SYLF domain-containing protein